MLDSLDILLLELSSSLCSRPRNREFSDGVACPGFGCTVVNNADEARPLSDDLGGGAGFHAATWLLLQVRKWTLISLRERSLVASFCSRQLLQ